MRRKITIYLDTSVISALFDERKPERMLWTQEFWSFIDEFEIYISDVVIAEIGETPDPKLRRNMLEAVKGLNILEFNEEAEWLGNEYVRYEAIPERYRKDAFHLSIATVNEIDILLSWNYRHIVRRKTKKIVNLVNELYDYPALEIMTPPEILGGGG